MGAELIKPINGDLDRLSAGALTVQVEGTTFRRRLNGTMRVWTFPEVDLFRVASWRGWQGRQDINQMIEALGLEEAIVLLGDDPLRLKQYIQLYHPELAPEDIDAVAIAGSMRGLRAAIQEE